MATQTLTALYDSYEQAARAVDALERADVPHADIAIVTSNSDGRAGAVDTPPGGELGARAGATTGTVLGGAGGLLVGLSLLSLPALGPVAVAGWIAATLVGVGAGASFGSAAGGLVGSLVKAGVTEDQANFYAESVRRGGTILTVKVSPERATEIDGILAAQSRVDWVERHRFYADEGWTRFDERARPFTAAEIARENERYRLRTRV
jgi:hypothetical protein